MAGVDVVWAANHWPAAVAAHCVNHPSTTHSCQDLHQVDWTAVPPHDLLLASPACQGHSRARGSDRPHHDASRASAWAVVACAEVHRPAAILVENVPEFSSWVLFPTWCEGLVALGYRLHSIVVDAADVGVPQNRRRLFLAASRASVPVRLQTGFAPHAPFRDVMESVPESQWTRVSSLCDRTRSRVRAGRSRFGHEFLVPYYGSGSGLTGRSLDRPVGTITTRDRWAVVRGDRIRMLTVNECRAAMGFPDSYRLPSSSTLSKHLLGNAVCPPVAAHLILQIIATGIA